MRRRFIKFTDKEKCATFPDNSRNFHQILNEDPGRVTAMQKILFCLAAIVLCISVVNAQEAPPGVRMAAEAGLPHFLSLIPTGERSSYGFTKDDVLDQAYLAEPFNLHTIAPPALLGYQPGDSVPALLSKTSLWYFPVMMRDKVRAILVVDQVDGKWQAVSLGYVPLAQQLQGVLQQWPRAKGFHPLLIAVFQAKEHLIMVPEVSSHELISLAPLKPGLEMKSAGNILERLKPIVADNLKQKF